MKNNIPFRRSVLIATMTILVAGTGVLVSSAQPAEGCGRTEGQIVESTHFTPHEARLSHLPDFPLTTVGQSATSSDRRMDGLPLRWSAGDGSRSIYEYFLREEIDRELTVPAFRAAGGVEFNKDVVEGSPYTSADVITEVGERAVEVQIGDYKGALVWADPESNGARPHHLYWSDEAYNYTLIAVRSPQRMVDLAREFVCGA